MSRRSTRREFVRNTTLAGVGVWLGTSAVAKSRSALEELSFACVGVGGKGSSDADQASNFGNIVAICDIDENQLNEKAKSERFNRAAKYFDFRKMLDELGGSIDAVTVSTPDHTHAPASVMAMRMGKHVYCQKPLTHSVHEARMMREVAQGYRVATQMGNQGTAEDGVRRAVEIVQDGVIGPVREAHVWTNRPVWPQAPDVVARPTEAPPIPSEVHWDEFLGPAPNRPYHGCYHPFNWRGWWDYGTGALGDMACHTANMAFMALNLGYPTSVVAECGEINPETFPAWARITYQFPARGEMVPCKLVWYEGKIEGQKVLPPAELMHGNAPSDSGLLLVGDKGVLFSPNDYGAEYKLLPEKEFEGYTGPAERLARNGGGDNGMKAEWVAAIKGGPAPFSNFGYAGLLTETILLGNVAMRVGKMLEWDGPNLRCPNCPEADQFIRREYRSGWTL